MKTIFAVFALIIGATIFPSPAPAENIASTRTTCKLVFNGDVLWSGTCYITRGGAGEIHAAAQDSSHCHARGGPDRCTVTEVCAGPWVNLYKSDSGSGYYNSDWSTDSSCHADADLEGIEKIAPGGYVGDGYSFTIQDSSNSAQEDEFKATAFSNYVPQGRDDFALDDIGLPKFYPLDVCRWAEDHTKYNYLVNSNCINLETAARSDASRQWIESRVRQFPLSADESADCLNKFIAEKKYKWTAFDSCISAYRAPRMLGLDR